MRNKFVLDLAPCALALLAGCGLPLAEPAGSTGPARLTPVETATPASPWLNAAPVFFNLEAQGIGDPNPLFHDGRYYVFYLQNEGRHPWRMSSSTDLSNWTAPIDAVPVGDANMPDHWTGSGSVIADPAGGFRIYYTGHLPDADPKEVVMSSQADLLAGPWRKVAVPHFDGTPQYSSLDFRDPFVFWNEEVGAWWMLLTTRTRGRAAIGRYTSADALDWVAAAPLYTEDSALNLEVPDLFHEGSDWYMLFSDQRQHSRQTRYLKSAASAGPFTYGWYGALDGRGFYAGKTAGTGSKRMLFGWVAHRRGRTDDGDWDWGGDLVAHALRRTAKGHLAAMLSPLIADQFTRPTGRIANGSPSSAPVEEATRIVADVIPNGDKPFGLRFHKANQAAATLQIDPSAGQARFFVGNRVFDAPTIAFPPRADGNYHIDVLLDPRQGFGVLYLNDFRALSFRYYGLGGSSVDLYVEGEDAVFSGQVLQR